MAWSKDIASVHATSQDQHFQVILGEQNPAFILQVNTRVTEHTAHCNQLFIIYLQHITFLERIAKHFFRIKTLTKVNVKHFQCIFRHGIQELIDCFSGNHASLCQRTKANRCSLFSQPFQSWSVRNIIPCHTFLYIITRNSFCIQFYLNRTCRIRYFFNHTMQILLIEVFQNFCS